MENVGLQFLAVWFVDILKGLPALMQTDPE